MSDPSPAEIMRRLDEVSRQLAALAAEMRAERAEAAKIYVRQDVYLAQRQADQAVVADTAGDVRALTTKVDGDVRALATKVEQTETARRNAVRWGVGTALTVISVLLVVAGLVLNHGA